MAPMAPEATNKKQPEKKSRRKKSRISKHVIKARENKSKEIQESSLPNETLASIPSTMKKDVDNTKTNEKKRKKKKKHIKDPNEAMSYLSGWKHRAVEGAWKFNKNTQSWLIRHMYEPDKVSKEMFTLLAEYLSGLEGTTRQRVQLEASSRAIRYKEYEKKLSAEPKLNDGDSPSKQQEEPGKQDTATDSDNNNTQQDNERWNRLSDHEKRKEYKRARKVLDSLKKK